MGYWRTKNHFLEASFHFLYKQLTTIDSMVSSWRLVVITVMYLTRVLPAPWLQKNKSYCDSLGNPILPTSVASVIPFYFLPLIHSILDTIQPETVLEKLGTKLCFLL